MVEPEPADASEVSRGGVDPRRSVLQGKDVSILKFQGAQAAGLSDDLIGCAIDKNPFDQGQGVELDGVVVVRPGLPRPLGQGVAAGHVGQLAKGHGLVGRAQVPAPVPKRGIHAPELALLYGKEEQRREEGVGCRSPAKLPALVAPGVDLIAVAGQDALLVARGLHEGIELGLADKALWGR